MITLVGLVIYILWNPELLKKIPFFNKNNKLEKFSIETKEEGTLQLTSPTLSSIEIKQIIKMKNQLIKPYTLISSHPNISNYRNISNLDFKNLQSYLANLLQDIQVDGIKFKIVPTSISPNIYLAFNNNLAYITPIEIQGTIIVNNKSFGQINLMIILKGSTNTIYIPKEGMFLNGKKYEMYVDNITINSISKNDTKPNKQKGFYAVADTIDMRVTQEQQDFNKTPQEIKIQRKQENPLTTFTELEDSEENFNLSEIIKNENLIEPDSENVSSVNINY